MTLSKIRKIHVDSTHQATWWQAVCVMQTSSLGKMQMMILQSLRGKAEVAEEVRRV